MNAQTRISFLDGLRGVAILLVVLFHAFARWPNIVPYGRLFASFPIFEYGWLGVQLFFLISGFAIFMTLERCTSFKEFILRRWFRLFPAMLVCSLIIFLTAPLFPERPAGQVYFSYLIPGLTFIDPDWWSKIFGFKVRGLEDAFWSLYIEAKFYIVFGILYFIVGWRKAIIGLFTMFVLSIVISLLRKVAPGSELYVVNKLFNSCGAQFFGWFTSGALYYKYYSEKKNFTLICAIAVSIISALVEGGLRMDVKIPACLIGLLFLLAIVNTKIQSILSHPILLFIGFISYPLYLIHENMMVALIVKLGNVIPLMFSFIIPIIPIAIVIVIGWVVAKYLEPWIREKLRLPYNRYCILYSKDVH